MCWRASPGFDGSNDQGLLRGSLLSLRRLPALLFGLDEIPTILKSTCDETELNRALLCTCPPPPFCSDVLLTC